MLAGVSGLSIELADKLIENAVGIYGLPLGVATNFLINGRDVLVPMVIEEPSVIAGASFAAKLTRDQGGFTATSSAPEMIGQIQVLDIADLAQAKVAVLANRPRLLEVAAAQSPAIVQRGGGPRDLEIYILDKTPASPMLIVHLIFDCRDAMGANLVNSACEALADPIEEITGGRVGLRILSNLSDRRTAKAECAVPLTALAFDRYSGEEVADRIIEAWAFAEADPYRAATHNKGIMNGIDAVVIATGNDWRAMEAGAHAFAARTGRYTSLSTWSRDTDGNLVGSLEMPMAIGIIGGSIQAHPVAQVSLKILNVQSANELSEIVVSVGLAQNLAALRALATEGIQKGHMALHARQVAVAAGAAPDQVERVVKLLLADRQITLSRAESILKELAQEVK